MRAVVFCLGVLLLPLTASAEPILYRVDAKSDDLGIPFTAFMLIDRLAPQAITTESWYTYIEMSNVPIWGTYGEHSFSGIGGINTFGIHDKASGSSDSWITRSYVTGTTIGGLTPTRIGLFQYFGPGNPADVEPSPFGGQFVVTLTGANGDTRFPSGRFASIVRVPEPGTLGLFALGAIGLVARRRRVASRM